MIFTLTRSHHCLLVPSLNTYECTHLFWILSPELLFRCASAVPLLANQMRMRCPPASCIRTQNSDQLSSAVPSPQVRLSLVRNIKCWLRFRLYSREEIWGSVSHKRVRISPRLYKRNLNQYFTFRTSRQNHGINLTTKQSWTECSDRPCMHADSKDHPPKSKVMNATM